MFAIIVALLVSHALQLLSIPVNMDGHYSEALLYIFLKCTYTGDVATRILCLGPDHTYLVRTFTLSPSSGIINVILEHQQITMWINNQCLVVVGARCGQSFEYLSTKKQNCQTPRFMLIVKLLV